MSGQHRCEGGKAGKRLLTKTDDWWVQKRQSSTHPGAQARVAVHGDDFAFAGTESELKKFKSEMCEILRSGRRDFQDIEILGRTPEWTEQSLEYEAGDKHRHALLRGLGLGDDSKTVNSAGMKEEELSQDEDEGDLGSRRGVEKFGGDVEQHEVGQIRCAVRGGARVQQSGESDTEKLERPEECWEVFERNPTCDVGDAGMGERRCERRRARGPRRARPGVSSA